MLRKTRITATQSPTTRYRKHREHRSRHIAEKHGLFSDNHVAMPNELRYAKPPTTRYRNHREHPSRHSGESMASSATTISPCPMSFVTQLPQRRTMGNTIITSTQSPTTRYRNHREHQSRHIGEKHGLFSNKHVAMPNELRSGFETALHVSMLIG